MKLAAIVLAAGSSRRLGQPKQDILLWDETLLERAVRVANRAGLDPIYVIVRPGQQIEFTAPARTITNEDAAEGMASSIRTGVLAATQDEAEGVLILACDQPAVTAEHLSALAANGSQIVASSYAARKGIPAYFPASAFPMLLELRGDKGARDLIADARSLPLPDGELDIDTAEDLARARELYINGQLP
jgi:CTP:molybdopterin cytidylyltransferase MocA